MWYTMQWRIARIGRRAGGAQKVQIYVSSMAFGIPISIFSSYCQGRWGSEHPGGGGVTAGAKVHDKGIDF